MEQPLSLPFPVSTSALSTETHAVATLVDTNDLLNHLRSEQASGAVANFNTGPIITNNNIDNRRQTDNRTTTNGTSEHDLMKAVLEELKEIKAGQKVLYAAMKQYMGAVQHYIVGRSGEAAVELEQDSIQPYI